MGTNVGRNPNWRKTRIGPIDCYLQGKRLLGEDYFVFLGIAMVGSFIGGLVPLILLGPMMCGMAICLLKKSRGQRMAFDDLFKGFDFFVPGLLANLCYTAMVLLSMLPFLVVFLGGIMMVNFGDDAIAAAGVIMIVLAYIGLILLVFVVQLAIFFACSLIVDRNMDGWPAFKLACQGIRGNFFQLLGCAIVGQLILGVALMMCFIPFFFAIPLVFAGHFMAYQKIFGLTEKPVMAEVVV